MHFTFNLKPSTLFLSIFSLLCFAFPQKSHAQLADECKLDIGINMAGLADFGTELPFVDLMKNARTWFAKDIGGEGTAYYEEFADQFTYRPDGYPTHMPQTTSASIYPQKIL